MRVINSFINKLQQNQLIIHVYTITCHRKVYWVVSHVVALNLNVEAPQNFSISAIGTLLIIQWNNYTQRIFDRIGEFHLNERVVANNAHT